VVDGRFTVDMNFKNETPSNIVKGKSLRLRLELSKPRNVLLIPVGGFYIDTRGKWVFLVQDKNRVVRRNVRLGCKNSDHFEVLEGLKAGDQVITSSYDQFENEESLDLTELRKSFL
jgi:HlyD family secretion protein